VTSLLTFVLLAVLVLGGACPAAAHSLLLASTPAADAVLKTSPSVVMLRFNNRIEKRLSSVRLVDERGAVATAPRTAVDDETDETLWAVVPPLAAGIWRVEWQVFSTDGHVVSGSYQFRLAP
jgi:methionine-rich copper-binding protein CopC